MMGDELDDLGKFGEERYTTDVHGNRVLYGLTLEETREFEELMRNWWTDRRTRDGKLSYLSFEQRDAARARRTELRNKHDLVWLEVIGAQLAPNKPTSH